MLTMVGSMNQEGFIALQSGEDVKNSEIQNTDVTMTEEDIEYIRQMLEEDREILVKLS